MHWPASPLDIVPKSPCFFFFFFSFFGQKYCAVSNYGFLVDMFFINRKSGRIRGWSSLTIQRFSRAGPRGRAREWAALGVHPLSWLLSNNRLEEVCGTLTKGTFSSRLLLSNQVKGCTPSVAHSLPLPLPPGFCSTCQLSLVPKSQQ